MAKGLPSSNAPPDIFQLFNENRTFYFESDISSLPSPSCPMPATPVVAPTPRLHKTMSQPQLSMAHTTASEPSKPASHAAGDLHLPTAIMANTSFQDPSRARFKIGGSDFSSAEHRYRTEPTYGSSQILKSFKQELRLFGSPPGGQGASVSGQRASVSTPTSPRRQSMPTNSLDVLEEERPRSNSDPRRLALVAEEVGTGSDSATAVAQVTTQVTAQVTTPLDTVPAAPGAKGKLLSSAAVDRVDGGMSRAPVAGSKNLPMTRQVMEWFTTPQAKVRAKRTEFNAMSPSSF